MTQIPPYKQGKVDPSLSSMLKKNKIRALKFQVDQMKKIRAIAIAFSRSSPFLGSTVPIHTTSMQRLSNLWPPFIAVNRSGFMKFGRTLLETPKFL